MKDMQQKVDVFLLELKILIKEGDIIEN